MENHLSIIKRNTVDWNRYVGCLISVLIVGKDDKTENYMGLIEEITDDGFMVLNPNNPEFTVEMIIFKTDLIKSVWIYKNNHVYKKKNNK